MGKVQRVAKTIPFVLKQGYLKSFVIKVEQQMLQEVIKLFKLFPYCQHLPCI